MSNIYLDRSLSLHPSGRDALFLRNIESRNKRRFPKAIITIVKKKFKDSEGVILVDTKNLKVRKNV